jgi:hypothetical protein
MGQDKTSVVSDKLRQIADIISCLDAETDTDLVAVRQLWGKIEDDFFDILSFDYNLIDRVRVKKPVLCIETGEVFKSLTDAARSKGLSSPAPIWQAIQRGGRSRGYTWRYADEQEQGLG